MFRQSARPLGTVANLMMTASGAKQKNTSVQESKCTALKNYNTRHVSAKRKAQLEKGANAFGDNSMTNYVKDFRCRKRGVQAT